MTSRSFIIAKHELNPFLLYSTIPVSFFFFFSPVIPIVDLCCSPSHIYYLYIFFVNCYCTRVLQIIHMVLICYSYLCFLCLYDIVFPQELKRLDMYYKVKMNK